VQGVNDITVTVELRAVRKRLKFSLKFQNTSLFGLGKQIHYDGYFRLWFSGLSRHVVLLSHTNITKEQATSTSTLKMEAGRSSETLECNYKSTRRNNPEDQSLSALRPKNLTSYCFWANRQVG
jgi:hypothetical protein